MKPPLPVACCYPAISSLTVKGTVVRNFRPLFSPALKNLGSTGHVKLPKRHATSEDQTVVDMRSNWQRRNQPIATSKLPRGEFVKT